MIPLEAFREYNRRIDPAWKQYQKELKAWYEVEYAGIVWHGRTPYGRFQKATRLDMQWLLAEVKRLRGDGA